jgi:hypothetical protein
MFDITTSTELFAVLVEDFDEFMAEMYSSRKALHCATTAYHLREWVWRDWLKHDAATRDSIGASDEQSFNEWINRSCIWFPIVRQIVNGNKHFTLQATFETMRVGAAPFSLDQIGAGFEQGAWDGPVRFVSGSLPVGPEGKGYLLIDFGPEAGDHRWLTAASLLEVVVRFWRDFFRKFHANGPNLPASQHHFKL